MTTAFKIIDIPNMAGVLTVLLEDLHELETKDNLFENVATIIDEVDDALMNAQSKLQEIKKEEIVEEVKPKLRRETFENSSLLRRVGLTKLWNQYLKKNKVGRRAFLLLLLVTVPVPKKHYVHARADADIDMAGGHALSV